MYLTHTAGDQPFIDYTGKKPNIEHYHTGEIQNLEVFVYVLGSSQYSYIKATAN